MTENRWVKLSDSRMIDMSRVSFIDRDNGTIIIDGCSSYIPQEEMAKVWEGLNAVPVQYVPSDLMR